MTDKERNLEQEVRQAYAWTRNTANVPAVDVDKEWQRFCTGHPQSDRHRMGWQRWAVAASMLLLCTIGLAFGWKYLAEAPKAAPAKIEAADAAIASDSILEDSSKLMFRNTELSILLQELAARYGAQVRYRCHEEIYLYVELEKSWTLQQCVDFLNHFERVNLRLSPDNTIIAE